MRTVWNIDPGIGIGPLKFGMSRAQVAEFDHIMGQLDETTEELLPNGKTALNEFRDLGAPLCSFQDGGLRSIHASGSDLIDFRFHDVSVFDDDPKLVYSTLGRAAGAVYWHFNRAVMPSLGLHLVGFVMEYSDKGKPPVFRNRTTGFTWPRVDLFQPGYGLVDRAELSEISNQAL